MERIKWNSIKAVLVLLALTSISQVSQADPKLFQTEAVGVCVLSAELIGASGHSIGQTSFATVSSVSAKACEKEAAKSQEYRMDKVCSQAVYRDREPASENSKENLKYKISYQFIPDKKGNSISGSGQSGQCPTTPAAVSSN